jgi:hypothetical protein
MKTLQENHLAMLTIILAVAVGIGSVTSACQSQDYSQTNRLLDCIENQLALKYSQNLEIQNILPLSQDKGNFHWIYGDIGIRFTFDSKTAEFWGYRIPTLKFRNFRLRIFNREIDELYAPDKDTGVLATMEITGAALLEMLGKTAIGNLDEKIFSKLFLDELAIYLKFWQRKESKEHFEKYLKGLLSDLKSKNLESMALAFGKLGDVRNFSNLMKYNKLDYDGMQGEYQKNLGEVLSSPGGMITVDGCDFPKHGKYSVGVKRQRCGPIGKTENCQASVMAGYCSSKGRGLISHRLYLAKEFFKKKVFCPQKKMACP